MIPDYDPSRRGDRTVETVANGFRQRPLFPELAINEGNGFYGRDILSVREFDREKLNYLFGLADEMREMVERVGGCDLLRGRVLANLFYEPSTRTSSSFMAAMQRLGGSVIPINEVRYSSVMKGESLPDTVRTLECYADVIVLRHPEMGSAQIAADYAQKPVINAGDGAGEHPTQALLDLFTIHEELGNLHKDDPDRDIFDRIEGKTIAMVGDLKYGRTVHSLTQLLGLFKPARVCFVSPECLKMPSEYTTLLAEATQGTIVSQDEDLLEVFRKYQPDVVYMTRVQKERFEDEKLYEQVKDSYVVTVDLLRQAKEGMVLMHPLPRVGEIAYDVDQDPRAAYFRQVENGMYIRMALLAAVLGRA